MAEATRNLTDEEAADLRLVMSSEQGRRVIRRLLAKTGMYMSVFRSRPNVRPEERLTFNAAQAEVGVRLQAEVLEASPDMYVRMNSEAAARKLLERNPAPATTEGGDSGGE